MAYRRIAPVCGMMLAILAPVQAPASSDPSLLDLIETEIGYSTIVDQYYAKVPAQTLLDGARAGLIGYLRSRGVAQPHVAVMHARPDGRGAVPAIEQQLGRAIVRYGTRVDVHEAVYAIVRGELAALHDPYSVFFTKQELSGFTSALDGTAFGGIGIIVAGDAGTNAVRVDDVFDGGPAARAGILRGDVIVAIDDVAVDAAKDLGARLRGKPGTVVRLAIVRDGEPLPEQLAIARAVVVPPDVSSRAFGEVGYVALRTFGINAGRDVRRTVQQLDAGGARAIVLDLRGNGGGYLSAAAHVASVFVADGPVVATQEKHGARHVTRAEGNALPRRPLAVLVDHDSASGSELVTAALAEHRLATVVGVRTYGKGLVQSVVPLPDGAAIKLTTARYFTPAGHNIDRVGITPDIEVGQSAGALRGIPGRDPQLDSALDVLCGQSRVCVRRASALSISRRTVESSSR